jgi:sulfur-oxidizing protein SoxY
MECAMKKSIVLLVLLGAFSAAPALADEQAERRAHWADLKEAVFGDRATLDGAGLIALEAPKRALDAALVPITVTTRPDSNVTGVTVVIDDNPGPVAAKVTYGPRGDPSLLSLRVRVNQYTYMHAVAETADGALHETAQFVKAAGGCSAPVGAGEAESLAQIGRMKLRLGEVAAGRPVDAQLLVRHPNFNGMQMDQLTRLYTPMRYVQQVEITLNDARVLSMENDISLATDPAIGFRFVPRAEDLPGKLKVTVRDSDGAVFEHSFDVPASGS